MAIASKTAIAAEERVAMSSGQSPGTPSNFARVDPGATEAFLRAILEPPIGCCEVRVLNASMERNGILTTHPSYQSTFAAWYDYPDDVLVAARSIRGVSAYIAINPIRSELLARSNTLAKQRATSTDADVVALRNILLDFDARRPSGISSTDAELAAALARRDQVLADHPELVAASIWGCSGNGGFILVGLPDLPNDEVHRKLVKEFIDLLSAKYSDQAVEVDPTMGNPSRIMALVSTKKCKGVNTRERPHRTVTLDSDPAKVRQPLDLLAWLDQHRPPQAPSAAPPSGSNGHTTGTTWEATVGGDAVKHAIAYLATCGGAVDGQGGSKKCFGVACRIGPGFDLPEDVCLRLIRDHYNPKCQPPWSDKELSHKVSDAYKKAKSRGWLLQKRKPQSACNGAAKNKDGWPYLERDSETYRLSVDKDGELVEQKIAGFTARITREIIRHDAGETCRQFEIKATLADGTTAAATIKAADFEPMAWPASELGSKFTIEAGRGCRDMMRHALQVLSHREKVEYQEVYSAFGWHQINGEPVYLHASGGISAAGSVAVHVEPAKESLAVYSLPAPEGARLAQAVEQVLMMHDTLDSPLVAAIVASLPWRAVLGPARFVVHFSGSTGSRKTSCAVLCTRHFAPGLEYNDTMPATWEATVNGLQRLQHDVGDMVLPVDNLIADGDQADRTRYKCDVTINAQGDLTGKQRMRTDGTLAPALDPRGCLLSTGEIDPQRWSALGRRLVVEFEPGTIDLAKLVQCHDIARAGHLAQAMAGYIKYLAAPGKLDEKRQALRQLARDYQSKALKHCPDCHARHAEAVGDLVAAFSLFLGFAVEQGVLASSRADKYVETVRDSLFGLLAAQASIQHESDVGELFLDLVRSLLASKRAVLSATDGTMPPVAIAGACGWKHVTRTDTHGNQYLDWQPAPGAARIGWVDNQYVYLDPSAAHAAAERLARETRQALGAQRQILARLAETNRILLDPQTPGTRRRFTRRTIVEKSRRPLLCLPRDEVLLPDSSTP
jgi:hypothetical protein